MKVLLGRRGAAAFTGLAAFSGLALSGLIAPGAVRAEGTLAPASSVSSASSASSASSSSSASPSVSASATSASSAAAASAGSSSAPAEVPSATLTFTSEPTLTLYAHPADADVAFTPLCTAPCAAHLAQGRHVFALGRGDEAPRPTHRLRITGDGAVVGSYQSANAYRIGGVAVLAVGLTLGSYILATSQVDDVCDADEACASTHPGGTKLVLGIATIAASIGVGAWMLSRRDQVTLTVAPGVAPVPERALPASEGKGAEGRGALPALTGLTVRASL